MNNYILLFLFGVLLANYSQILLKKATLQKYDSKLREYANRYVIIGYTLFVINACFNLIALKGISLAVASVLESCSYIIMLLFSRLFLGEPITPRKVIGNVIIICGIIIFFIK
ncbi:EamA family transporter [Ectobacillus sp. sgz5001026]|uniref:EamA family transporter n=1 Tax=Ectobacillus sp. sgz5001026 TaxID=3242473 RepID=UPI0036D34785